MFRSSLNIIQNMLKRDMSAFAKSKDGLFEVVSLTPEKLEEAFDVTRKTFFEQESLCEALRLNVFPKSRKEVEEFFWNVAKEGVSVVGLEKKTGKVFGMLYNKLWEKGQENTYESFTSKWKEEPSQIFAEYITNSTNYIDIFKYHKETVIFETMFGMVDVEFENKKLGQLLIEASLEIAKTLRRGENCRTSLNEEKLDLVVPTVAMSFSTAEAAKNALNKKGFKSIDKISLDNFFPNNQPLAQYFRKNGSSINVSLLYL